MPKSVQARRTTNSRTGTLSHRHDTFLWTRMRNPLWSNGLAHPMVQQQDTRWTDGVWTDLAEWVSKLGRTSWTDIVDTQEGPPQREHSQVLPALKRKNWTKRTTKSHSCSSSLCAGAVGSVSSLLSTRDEAFTRHKPQALICGVDAVKAVAHFRPGCCSPRSARADLTKHTIANGPATAAPAVVSSAVIFAIAHDQYGRM
jgi:hypothetical protein